MNGQNGQMGRTHKGKMKNGKEEEEGQWKRRDKNKVSKGIAVGGRKFVYGGR